MFTVGSLAGRGRAGELSKGAERGHQYHGCNAAHVLDGLMDEPYYYFGRRSTICITLSCVCIIYYGTSTSLHAKNTGEGLLLLYM